MSAATKHFPLLLRECPDTARCGFLVDAQRSLQSARLTMGRLSKQARRKAPGRTVVLETLCDVLRQENAELRREIERMRKQPGRVSEEREATG